MAWENIRLSLLFHRDTVRLEGEFAGSWMTAAVAFSQTHKSSLEVSSQSMVSTISNDINKWFSFSRKWTLSIWNLQILYAQYSYHENYPICENRLIELHFYNYFHNEYFTHLHVAVFAFIIMWKAKIERRHSFSHSSYQLAGRIRFPKPADSNELLLIHPEHWESCYFQYCI